MMMQIQNTTNDNSYGNNNNNKSDIFIQLLPPLFLTL